MSHKLPRVLVVDDEPQIRRFLRASLTGQGYELVEAADAKQALEAVARDKPDVIVLDLGLPDQDGFAILESIRKTSLTPVLILSARDDVAGKVRALELGADDYVTKPFDMPELVARLKAALRHGLQSQGETPTFKTGSLAVDLIHRRVLLNDAEIKLTPKEYDVLRLMVRHAGKVLTHQSILREVWGPAHVDDVQYLRVLMRQLRQKIEGDPSRPQLLLTEPGVGYRLFVAG